ncbi:MAG TPA: hypothetical protein VNT79_08710 [Phycisphaerae bacterium]|nr:hypothetical protein [Phycisphaerae bacterium]
MDVIGGIAYVADWHMGLQVANVVNPAGAFIIGSYDTPGAAGAVVVSGSLAYVADAWNGLQIIDVSNAASPVLAGSVDTPGSATAVAVSGNRCYLADSDEGVAVVDVSDSAVPVVVDQAWTPHSAQSVMISGNRIFVGASWGGMVIYGACGSGDMDCDEQLTLLDVDGMVQALLYGTSFPGCQLHNGDLNGDTAVNGLDLQLFTDVLLGS